VLILPDDIDDRSIPIPVPHAAIVEIDDGGLLVDEEAGRGYALNATASLLWKLFDSRSPLGELIDDVSAAFGVPRQDVADSCLGLVRVLGELGLFENVARSFASLPIDIEYVDEDECGEPIRPEIDEPSFDSRYLASPPSA
jgi:hypothetical protein